MPKECQNLIKYLKFKSEMEANEIDINNRKLMFLNILNLNVLMTTNEKDGKHIIRY
jgi:hypothetical protein